jgi:asparagine synthase (glutamine-hydrolysing)
MGEGRQRSLATKFHPGAMCGISGYAYPQGQLVDNTALLLRMVWQLARRGPDDEGLALFSPEERLAVALGTPATVEGARLVPRKTEMHVPVESAHIDDGGRCVPHRIAFGHRRFSIIDPTPAGHQPFWSADGSVCVAFNGEIYNYVELRADLEAAGRRFGTRSDTEVLAEAFLHWGEECFERFIGFWAVALYDRRREGLLLARDRMGKAPLYFSHAGGRLYWASEINSLRAGVGWGAFDIRSQAVADFVTYKLRDVNELTFFEGVENFPRGCWGWVSNDASVKPQKYWSIPSRRRTEGEIAPGEAALQLRAVLTDSVRLRHRADVPVGIELSGGLDSSAIAAAAADSGHRLRAYTVSFPGTEWDEAHFAEAVARRWDGAVDYTVIRPTSEDFFEAADDFVAHMQEPFHSPNVYDKHQIWREMAASGIRVSLNGSAGDELFCGYPGIYLIPYLSALLETGRLRRLHREATLFVEKPATPGSRLYWERLAKAAFHSVKRRSRTVDALGAQRRAAATAQPLLARSQPATRQRAASIEALVEERATDWLLSYWLRLGHQNSMGVPIEARVPFLDHRLVELAFSLPVAYSIRDGRLKWILREAFAGLLPDEVTSRPTKLGFPFPIKPWLTANKDRFFGAVAGRSDPCPYVDLKALSTSYDAMVALDPDMLWRAMSVCLWWKRCILNEPLYAPAERRNAFKEQVSVAR